MSSCSDSLVSGDCHSCSGSGHTLSPSSQNNGPTGPSEATGAGSKRPCPDCGGVFELSYLKRHKTLGRCGVSDRRRRHVPGRAHHVTSLTCCMIFWHILLNMSLWPKQQTPGMKVHQSHLTKVHQHHLRKNLGKKRMITRDTALFSGAMRHSWTYFAHTKPDAVLA